MKTNTIETFNWNFTDRIRIGIDVGWSERRRSCAIAIKGATPPDVNEFTKYIGNGENVFLKLFRKRDVLAFLETFAPACLKNSRCTTLIIDGPLGQVGPPQNNRLVDSELRRNGFYGRAQPSDITGVLGTTYVQATYEILKEFLQHLQGNPAPWWGTEGPFTSFTFAETHPTVGLALLMQKQNPGSLPSRNRPLKIQAEGPYIRAKSDWYWQKGAGNRVAGILGCPEIVNENHHERVAGLFCLSIAELLSKSSPEVIAVGNEQGIYVVPRHIDNSWRPDVDQLPRVFGKPVYENFPVNDQVADQPVENTPAEPEMIDNDPDLFGKSDDDLDLVLNDNAAAWQTRNPWLVDLVGPIKLMLLDYDRQLTVNRTGLGGQGQWGIVNGTSPLQLARELQGIHDIHLSNATPMILRVRLE